MKQEDLAHESEHSRGYSNVQQLCMKHSWWLEVMWEPHLGHQR